MSVGTSDVKSNASENSGTGREGDMMMKQAVKKIINASLKSRGFRLCRTDDQTGSTWEYDYLHNQIDDLKMLSSKMVIDHMLVPCDSVIDCA